MTAPRVRIVAVALLATCVRAATVQSAPARTRTGPLPIQTSHGGFAWVDAAIGAAAAFGLVLVVAGVHFLKGDRNAS